MRTNLHNRRRTYLVIWGVGFWSVLAGLVLLLGQVSSPVYAQDETSEAQSQSDLLERTYIGARECSSCHRGDVNDLHEESAHALTLREADDDDAVLADFSSDDVPEFQFPGQETAQPITADDLAYAVGAGRKIQRYLYETDDEELLVLPFEWNVEEQAWQPYTAGHPGTTTGDDWTTNCAGCHTTGLDLERSRWEDDGVQCEACHGPGSEHQEIADQAGRRASEEEVLEIRAAIYNSPDAQMCGQCHSAGLSADGLPFPNAYRPGLNLLDSYTLVAPDDSAHWWPTGHARQINMQFNEWLTNGHANALNALNDSGQPVEDLCLSCHSADAGFMQRRAALYEAEDLSDPAPQPATAETAQFGVTCIACHAPHTGSEDGDRVAYQIGSSDVYALCTQCHTNTNLDFIHYPAQEMFEGVSIVPNVEALPSSHFTEETGPRCATCHMDGVPTADNLTVSSHSLQPVLPGPATRAEGLPDSCLSCHQKQVNAIQMQALIDDVQADTQTRLDTLKAAITDTTADWAKTALAFVEGDGSLGIHNYAYTDALLDAVEAELGLDQPDTGDQPGTGS